MNISNLSKTTIISSLNFAVIIGTPESSSGADEHVAQARIDGWTKTGIAGAIYKFNQNKIFGNYNGNYY